MGGSQRGSHVSLAAKESKLRRLYKNGGFASVAPGLLDAQQELAGQVARLRTGSLGHPNSGSRRSGLSSPTMTPRKFRSVRCGRCQRTGVSGYNFRLDAGAPPRNSSTDRIGQQRFLPWQKAAVGRR